MHQKLRNLDKFLAISSEIVREDLIQFATLQINAIAAAAAAGELRSGDEAEDEAELEEDEEDVVIHTPIIDEETARRFYIVLPKDENAANDHDAETLSSSSGHCSRLQHTSEDTNTTSESPPTSQEKKATG